MGLFDYFRPARRILDPLTRRLLPDAGTRGSERGTRSTDEARIRAYYQQLTPSLELRDKIHKIRVMDQLDGTVKRIHHRTTHALTKGGLTLVNPTGNTRLKREYEAFIRATHLNNRNKLASDARGIMMEGNGVFQWVIDADQSRVMRAVRMPAETIRAITDDTGQISDYRKAYVQHDLLHGIDQTFFPYWAMDIVRLDPLNYDDEGDPGRPFLDASRKIWQQKQMTLDDLVIRRRERAPLRTAHSLEGANVEELADYKSQVEDEQREITTNYYMNHKGAVTAVQGDENLDQVGDIAMLLDGFFSGTPAPKGLFGYADGLARDVLTDMKEEFYDELDVLQDLQAQAYERGFRLHLLLKGINPDANEWNIQFVERATETLNQRTDRALKLAALGASSHTVWSVAGLKPDDEGERLQREADDNDPYPVNREPNNTQNISITPGNAGGGESATSITND